MMMSLSVNQIACNKEILLEVVCECFDADFRRFLLSLKSYRCWQIWNVPNVLHLVP